jgi:fluoroquinolone resistance protein
MDCNLQHASFYKLKLKHQQFNQCHLKETDFTAAQLIGSIFEGCDLAGAVFDGTNLEKADFATAVNYSIDPENNRIKKAKFSSSGLAGLLSKYDIEMEG